MTDDERILDLQNEITTLLYNIYLYDREEMPDFRDFEDFDVDDLKDLRDQIIDVFENMTDLKDRYLEEEQ